MTMDDRLVTLDVARGLAAICVVLYHWPLFFYVTEYGAPPENFPLLGLLAPVYDKGWLGADFFFVLSGAIFFIKYARTVSGGEVTARQFLVLRFSRLAPLHYATLILTIVLQAVLFLQFDRFVLYRENLDGWHFLANLLFIQNWSFIPSLDVVPFNPPSWSLSIEALLYIIFFVLLRYVPVNIFSLLAIAAAGLWLVHDGTHMTIGRGLWCFFLGGALAWFYTQRRRRERWKPELYGAAVLLLAALVFMPRSASSVSAGPLTTNIETAGYALYTGFFAVLVCCLVFLDGALHRVMAPFSFLGDISYSTYLLHYPLQLAVIFAVTLFGGTYEPALFRSPGTMLLFLAALIAAALLSFHRFEVPFRKALRQSFLGKKKPAPESVASSN
jgi:peptidoglycan/LPS O-acetylase OafA/YrhL